MMKKCALCGNEVEDGTIISWWGDNPGKGVLCPECDEKMKAAFDDEEEDDHNGL